MSNSDFIITLSWPGGEISAVGSWYDKILGLNRKYSIGHTAIVLINSITSEIYYLDFGRYHTPIGFGRVRDIETDPESTVLPLLNGCNLAAFATLNVPPTTLTESF